MAGDRYVYFSLEMESLLREFQRECAWETETYDGRKLEDADYIFRRHGLPAPHDALHLHLAVQADPEEARPAALR